MLKVIDAHNWMLANFDRWRVRRVEFTMSFLTSALTLAQSSVLGVGLVRGMAVPKLQPRRLPQSLHRLFPLTLSIWPLSQLSLLLSLWPACCS